MPTVSVIPDAELVVRSFLVGRTAVSDLVGTDERGEVRLYTVTPNPAPAAAFGRLIRVGGVDLPRRSLGRPLIQLEAYGGTKSQARLLAATMAAELEAIDGATVVAGYVQGVEPGTLRYLPDQDLQTERGRARERYIFDAVLTIRAARN